MQRNRILYFIIAVFLIVVGYVVRMTDISMNPLVEECGLAMEGSFVFITMGIYFLIAIISKKAAWYIDIYESHAGRIVIGGPFELRIFVYILVGMVLGIALELVLRQYNKVGL